MSSFRSGTQFELAHGDYVAHVASVGASLRSLTFRGRDLVVPFDADDVRPAFRGATLAPWPNRVVDGVYPFGGVDHILSLTEPNRGHALHGLVGWLDFALIEQSESRVVLEAVIVAQVGYPYPVAVIVAYWLDEDGLHETVTGRNLGIDPAPWGTGPHPYLVAGPGRVDDWTLTLPTAEVLTVTADRLIPTGTEPVESVDGGVFDFREPRVIGDTFIDHAFTGVLGEGERPRSG